MIAENTPGFLAFIDASKIKNILLECPACHKEFVQAKNVIQSKFGAFNNQKTIYCSHECSARDKRTAQKVCCLQCEIIFSKFPNQIARSPNHFCSRSCAGTYNSAHKTTGTRRSKLEVWLEGQITSAYPNMKVLFNTKETIESELDIYFPSINLAFELNGIVHYEPIYGEEKFASIKINDDKKLRACQGKQITLIIIDVSAQRHFTEPSSLQYLARIRQIIEDQLGGAG